MMRVVQLMVSCSSSSSSSSSSSGVISSPFHRSWKPIGFGFNNNLSISKQPLLPFFSPLISSSHHPINTITNTNTNTNTITCSSFKIKSFTLSAHSNSNSNHFSSKSQPLLVYFCQWCGSATKQDIPDGDDKSRAICTSCGKVTYQNPKMVTGCLVEHHDKVLLCKRKIPPSYGLWTLPAGYMEMGESAVEGATRETWEEAGAEVEVMSPFAQLDIPLIGQTYIIFRARLKTPQFSPGPESIECRLFALDEIPFDSLAFSSMLVTLNLYIEDLKAGKLSFHYGTINKRPGTGPSDIHSYTLDDHLLC